MAAPTNLASTFLRLRPDSAIEKLPFDETFWPRLMEGKLGNLHHEYLVTTSSFRTDWPSWERHPMGDEIVCLLSGEVTLVLELPGGNENVQLSRLGDFALIPRGTWHTAKTGVETTMLFITAGEGTEGRPGVPA
jgi:mannose-6-phosphate isomerase-like protein (cupin superfamily)